MDPIGIKDIIMMAIPVLGIVYATGRMTARFSSKDETQAVKDSVTALAATVKDSITAVKETAADKILAVKEESRLREEKKYLESQQEHRNYATKSALVKIENQMFDGIKEMRDEFSKAFDKLDEQIDKQNQSLDQKHNDLLGHIMGLAKQVGSRRGVKDES